MILEFKGKRYRHLISPGYAVTPDKGGIIFVTEKEGSPAILHFVPFKDGDEIKVDLGDSAFGIGLGFPKDDDFANYIEGMEGKDLILVAKFGKKAKERRFLLNLEARTFSEVPTTSISLRGTGRQSRDFH